MPVIRLTPELWTVIGTLATAGGTIATAVSVWLTMRQLRRGEDQTRTEFEDALSREYRAIVQKLPIGALLGDQLEYRIIRDNLNLFYEYFDLTNHQIYLRTMDRVRKETWFEWLAGIRDNFHQPAFAKAWQIIGPKAEANGTLNELRELICLEFARDTDPGTWGSDRPCIAKRRSGKDMSHS